MSGLEIAGAILLVVVLAITVDCWIDYFRARRRYMQRMKEQRR